MSILPKIKVGVQNRRERNNLSQDTHTTAEVGYMQPTFCRELVQKTHVSIDCKSLVRLSPLAVPTMGRISLRHYFSFVDYATLWTPFEAMRTGNNYTYSDGTTQTPFAVPFFSISDIIKRGFAKDRVGSQPKIVSIFYCTLYKNGTAVDVNNLGSELTACLPSVGSSSFPLAQFPVYYKQNTTQRRRISSITSSTVNVSGTGFIYDFFNAETPVVTNQNADFAFSCLVGGTDSYMFLCRYTTYGKRLRKHFIGLGYSFNPFGTTEQTPLKLFAEYKAWFDKFFVQRQINFNNTNCYKIIKFLSETAPLARTFPHIFDTSSGYADSIGLLFISFLEDLADICYVLPPDYFSASDWTTSRGAYGTDSSTGIVLDSYNEISGGLQDQVISQATPQQTPSLYIGNWSSLVPAQGIEMAMQMYRYVNKRSVAGRKVDTLLGLEGENDIHNNAHETVHHLGSSRVDVQISDVISQADTSSASLGDYAGRGIGFKDSETFVYDTPCQGVLLCLSAIVPTSGYFQGILKENTDKFQFDFFTEDFDALGYQSLAMSELISDLQFGTSSGPGNLDDKHGYFGLVPRYQHKKIGRNVCNADISLPSMQDVMLPYNLDRHFITRIPKSGSTYDFESASEPSVLPEVFRRVQADTGYGDYNRIFQYQANDYDHFIIHIVFNVPIVSPMKSVANSYDTFQEDDNKALEIAHE